VSLASLCGLFGYTRQAYHKSFLRRLDRLFSDERILDLVRQERELQPRMGTRKLYHLLCYKGIRIGMDRLYKLLRENDLLVRPGKRIYVRTTQSSRHWRGYSNLIKELCITAPNKVWVADITYIRLKEGFAYLSLLTDAYSRKIVGHSLHPTLETDGCLNALSRAMASVCWPELRGIIHHSDKGCQYCSKAYVKVIRAAGMRVSMTQNGDPYENALAERVNGILKTEWINQEEYTDFKAASERIDQIVELYNTRRLHSAIAYRTPSEVHQKAYTHTTKKARLKQQNVEDKAGLVDHYFFFPNTPEPLGEGI